MKKNTILSILCVCVCTLSSYAQVHNQDSPNTTNVPGENEEDANLTIPEFEPMFDCTFTGVKQHFVIHLENESILSIDFSEEPSEPLKIYDQNNVFVGTLTKQNNQIKLPTYKHYAIQGINSCGESGVFFTFSTIPQINHKAFGLPMNIYNKWTKNFGEGQTKRTVDFLRENETLTDLEKLLVIQEYYFDGDLAMVTRNEEDYDYDEDFPLEFGFGDLDGVILKAIDWTRINGLIDFVVWQNESNNCRCKTSWGDDGPENTHSIFLTAHTTPFRWFEHYVDHPGKTHWGHSDFYGVYKNEIKGAAKRLNAVFQVKRSGSDTYKKQFPENGAGTDRKTFITYTLACENNQRQDDNCLCDDRILEYQASYSNSLSTNASRWGSFGGFAATAQAEDWAVLTLSSKKQGLKVVDAGRASSKSERNATINSEYNNRIIDVAATLAKAYLATQTGTTAFIDSTLINQTADDIKYLINNSRMNGGGINSGSGGNELLGGCGTERTVELRPNDPMTITIHSFAGFELYGHTRWKTSAAIESNCYLAAYIDYKKTDECCNEEVLNWVIGVNDIQQNINALRCINSYFRSRPTNLPRQYPNTPFLEITGNNEWGYLVSDFCPPDYFEAFVVQEDDDILPIGTEYFLSSMLTGSVLKSETSQNEITLGDLKRLLASEGSFRHSFYSLKLVKNNEVQHLKIYID
jgi:hypothetical protein